MKKKIVISESQLDKLLNEAYPEKFLRTLMQKFYQEARNGIKIPPEEEIKYYKKQIRDNPDFPRYRDSLNRYIKMLESKLITKRREK